jgi:2-polyprenyl-3-methyl-5-hydroxy-6-metoxy-1,4-benzoquinol methylase
LGHEAYLKHKHGSDNLELFRMTLGDVGSLGRTFDLIVCTGVLHHLPDPGAADRRGRDPA